MAHFAIDRQRALLEKDAAYQAMSKAEQRNFMVRLEQAREQGYHFADSEITLGVTDFAAFVGQPETDLVAAVAVSSLSTGLDGDRDQDTIIRSVLQCADEINRKIGL